MKNENIGAFIAEQRKAKGWTQNDLAEQLHLTNKAISRWETGKGCPDITILAPLAAALDVSVNELLAGQRHSESLWGIVLSAGERRESRSLRIRF